MLIAIYFGASSFENVSFALTLFSSSFRCNMNYTMEHGAEECTNMLTPLRYKEGPSLPTAAKSETDFRPHQPYHLSRTTRVDGYN